MFRNVIVNINDSMGIDANPIRLGIRAFLKDGMDCFVSECGRYMMLTKNGSVVGKSALSNDVLRFLDKLKDNKFENTRFQIKLAEVFLRDLPDYEHGEDEFVFDIERTKIIRSKLYVKAPSIEEAKALFNEMGQDCGYEKIYDIFDDGGAEILPPILVTSNPE